jgi:peptide deformylase
VKIRIIGDEVLRQVATEIDQFDEKLVRLGEEMINLMHDSDGIGLAAPQVGISKRILVTDISPMEDGHEAMAFVNPVIIEAMGECTLEEGCLSIPNVREDVTRPEEILLKYHTTTGEAKTEKFSGWMARVLQHEIDHLDGVLFVDYLSPVKKKLIAGKFTHTS